MRETRAQKPLAGGLLGAARLTTAHPQTDSGIYRPLTLAPADANSSGGGGAGDETAREAELAKQSLNPVADLTIVPIQDSSLQPLVGYTTRTFPAQHNRSR
jgi:hypothetical protein